MIRHIPILLYHRVGEHDGSFMDDYTVSPKVFAAQMDSIKRRGWQPIDLERVAGGLCTNCRRSLVITFDDGFASNREYAWPILRRYGFPSATFVVTSHLGSFNKWDGADKAHYPLLSAEDLAAADPGLMRFHSHSATHPDLVSLSGDLKLLRRELEEPIHYLTDLRSGGRMFAYPFGSWNWEVMTEVKNSGYLGACTIMGGLNSMRANPFILRRTEIKESDVGWKFWLKVLIGREIFQWPPHRPSEVSILLAWLRRNRTLSRKSQ